MQKTKKNTLSNSSSLYLLGLLAWFLVFFLANLHPVTAATPSTFIQSYNSLSSLQEGMIVQLQKGDSTTVVPASQTSIYNTFGVIVNQADASIALENNSKTSDQVFVANSGHYSILVSDQNGPVNTGNYITLSSLNGVGMKDDSTEPIVVAQALNSFNSNSPILGSDQIKTSSGNETVHLGIVEANISIGHNPLLSSNNNDVPKVLGQFAQTVAGKAVSAWRIWLGLAVLFVVSFISGTMLYGAVRSSMISIGRNPLSKKAISKGFIEVALTALIIFISAVFGVYLLLKV
jgi:hypothetical protein